MLITHWEKKQFIQYLSLQISSSENFNTSIFPSENFQLN